MYKWIVFIVLVVACASANADQVGFAPAYSTLTLHDPDGDTETYSGVVPLSFLYVKEVSTSTRWISNVSRYNYSVKSANGSIGQNVHAYDVSGLLSSKLRIARTIKLWAGVGASYLQSNYTTRHIVDSDGFLIRKLANRELNYFSARFNIFNEWTINKEWLLSTQLNYEYALDDGFDVAQLGLTVFYKWR